MIPLIYKSPRAKILALLRSLGASTWLPGVKNTYLGAPAVQDGYVDTAADLSMGLYPATQSTTSYCPILRKGALNQLLGSDAPATQNVSVYAIPYVISIYGTGSITLSGAATGTLTGTGSGNRVYLAFTPTAGTLTLTVSGSVTSAMLEWMTTTPSAYVATTTIPLSNGIGSWWWDFSGGQFLNTAQLASASCTIGAAFSRKSLLGSVMGSLGGYTGGIGIDSGAIGANEEILASSTAPSQLTSSTPYLVGAPEIISARWAYPGNVDIWKNGAAIASAATGYALRVTASNTLTLGTWFPTAQPSNIAVYGFYSGQNISDAQRLSLDRYLGSLAGVSI